MLERKLSQAQEKQVAVAYFCGVSKEYICRNWGVSWTLAKNRTTIERARELNDPLVEFYRSHKRTGDFHNAAHLYLSCACKNVDHKSLVDKVADEPARMAIEEDIYIPAIRHVADESGICRFLEPANGYERLLCAVVGTANERMVAALKYVFPGALLSYYSGGRKFSALDVAHAAEESLVSRVKKGDFYLNDEKAALIDDVLKTLPFKQRKLVCERFGIPSGDGKSLAHIGRKRNYTRERIRQFEAGALYALRLESRRRVFEALALPLSNDDLPGLSARLGDRFAARVIADLELPKRTHNALLKAGVNYVEDIYCMGDDELMAIRGINVCGLSKIKCALKENGF